MKLMVGVAAVAGAIGVWAGLNGWQSDGARSTIYAGVAILLGANLVICSWFWWRAKPGSGDAMALPTVIVLSVAVLVGMLPRVIRPEAEGLQVAASLASAISVTVLVVVEMRKRWRGGLASGPR